MDVLLGHLSRQARDAHGRPRTLAVFIEGAFVLVLAFAGIRTALLRAIPQSIKLATTAASDSASRVTVPDSAARRIGRTARLSRVAPHRCGTWRPVPAPAKSPPCKAPGLRVRASGASRPRGVALRNVRAPPLRVLRPRAPRKALLPPRRALRRCQRGHLRRLAYVRPGYHVALVDPLTDKVGDEGEFSLDLSRRPVALMRGYRDDAERTAEMTRGGFYRTGDVASRDAEGYITYVGRADDVFKASDYRISPFELESVLIEHDAVAEAAVLPSPDPLRLSVPKAYVVLTAGHAPTAETAKSILKYAREKLAPYKRIRRLEFAELPKTISGKIRRVDLRKREGELYKDPEARPAGEFRDDDFPELRH